LTKTASIMATAGVTSTVRVSKRAVWPDTMMAAAYLAALVDRRWPAIERIAWLLLKHGTLSGDEVRAGVEPDVLTFEVRHAE
jgi:hypothetical protein